MRLVSRLVSTECPASSEERAMSETTWDLIAFLATLVAIVIIAVVDVR
jgi:hypothetical protein